MGNNLKKVQKFIVSKKYIIGILLAIIAVIVIVLSFRVEKNLNQYKIVDEKIYTYFSTEKLEYNSEITLDNKEGVTKMTVNGQTEDLGSEPLYYVSSEKVVFPKDMAVIIPQEKIKQKKVPHYTTITKNANGIFLQNSTIKIEASDKFLFDGDDMYFFLNDSAITYNDQSITISAMSYVIYNYNKELYIYDYEQDIMHYVDNVVGNVFATTEEYTINLGADSVICGTDEGLLLKNLDYLTNIE